jgi:hypothetical protein
MSSIDISVAIRSNKHVPDIMLTVILDDSIVGKVPASPRASTLHTNLDAATAGNHTLDFVLTGKTPAHTKLDQDQIIDDVLVYIDSLRFDGVIVDDILHRTAGYLHNTNDHTPESIHAFHGIMGCNGRVRLRFDTPIHLWLLNHTR